MTMPNEELAGNEAEPHDSGTATATAPVKRPAAPPRKPKRLPPYKVLLHNDEVSTFEHVISSVVQIAALATEDALLKTIEAHETGVSVLLVTHLERAELYVDQFATKKITVTIEPAEE
jgi:ATP-dependent Clp protease adaptor protein ClpS